MLDAHSLTSSVERQVLPRGSVLEHRAIAPPWVTYLESGRVTLGVLEGPVIGHQLGALAGPCWLEASSAVLNLPHAVDAVADTEVVLRRVPQSEFSASLAAMSPAARDVLVDVALAHRQQTELAVSRLAKDAEARCAEWLLRHAQPGEKGVMAVLLQQRKRSIAAQLGIAPETFSRVLRHLRERSLISGTGRLLNLDDLGGLRSLAGV
jgi:CRP/FNR family transcriptional regulator, dissimilatory nitrate respiration regulator